MAARLSAAATVTVPVLGGDTVAVRDAAVDRDAAGVALEDDVGAAPAAAAARGAAAADA